MLGRVKRKRLLHLEMKQPADQPPCALCGRPLGARVEWHHAVPKSEGGTVTVPVHPICHRVIHASVSNHDLATVYAELDQLKTQEDIARFLKWVANKPADFNAPTRRKRI